MGSKIHIDQTIISKLKAGDELAFELIFHRTKGKLKGFLCKVLPYDEDPESVMQEVYVKIWTNAKNIDPDKNFETFLFAIARNMVIDILRKKLQQQKYLESVFEQVKETNEMNLEHDTLEYSELEKKIVDAVERLPEKRRLIFKMSRQDGLTYKEISNKLHISENTVDTQIRSALNFLRREVSEYVSIMLLYFLIR